MSALPRRYRSSTSASNPPTSKSLEILTNILEGLTRDASTTQHDGFPDAISLAKDLKFVARHIAAAGTSAHQDDFRHAGGFERVLDVLRAFSGYYDPQKRNNTEILTLLRLLKEALGVLSAALRGHAGNKRFFRYRVDGGGWDALEQVIASIGLGGAEPDPWVTCHLFGKLLSFAVDDEAIDLLCQSIAKTLRPEGENSTADTKEDPDEDGEEQWDLVLAQSIENIGPSVKEVINSRTIIKHPEILRAVVSFWSALPRESGMPATAGSLIVLETIRCAAGESTFNQAAIHSTGVLSQFLRAVFGVESALTPPEREKALELCQMLMKLGINQPADVQFLLSSPAPDASEFCLDMVSKHSGPPFFQFDLSLHGYSSIELPSLGRSFPPQSSGGYTFTAWIRVDKYDPASHTTLFGVFDASQACFLLMYLEKDTHNFILQTSVISNKPSVRFRTVSFKEKQWYHIAIVHRRPKAMSASKASLYVNGEFAEQSRANYPSQPPLSNGARESFASFNSTHNRTNPVQAFIGTPRDLSGKIGPGLCLSKWSLASIHLLDDTLSDDYLAVHYGLGPRYQGNFQDSLGGFQTYQASATLGLRNEIAHPGKNENSDILRAIREKASALLHESKVLLSILPHATFPDNVQFVDTGLIRALPHSAARSLFRTSAKEGSEMVINCAVPYIPHALFKPHGIASFRGTPTVAVPSNLDENMWRLAGFTPLALKLLERATSVEEIVRSLEIMFYCIRESWRNSEAMERDNGYGILGMLLRFKLGYAGWSSTESPVPRLTMTNDERDSVTFRILSLVLDFVGYNHASPIDSFIINPLAYRILLIDLDIWRKSAPRIQELYYKQFISFAVKNKYHEFNCRRLLRMRIVKRLLDAVKGEPVPEETMPHFMSAFQVLVKASLSQEVMRSLSLFITYTFHNPPSSTARTPRPASAMSRSSTPKPISRRATVDSASGSSLTPKQLSKKRMGTKILAMYTDILCEKDNLNHIKKFARTVTNKWLLYLLADDDVEVVTYGCKILARLLVSQGSAYTNKFANKSGGFTIMAHRLKRFWDAPTIWPLCFSILFGYDIAEIELRRDFDLFKLVELFGKRKVVYPDSLQIITTMLQHGFKEVMRYQDDTDSPAGRPATAGAPHHGSLKIGLEVKPMDLLKPGEPRSSVGQESERVLGHAHVLQTVIQLLIDLHSRSADFRDFALSSELVRLTLIAIYPVVVSADPLTPEVELDSGDTALTFEGSDVIIRPIGGGSGPTPIVRTSSVEATPSPQSTPPKGTPLRRASSFVLLTSQKSKDPSEARLSPTVLPSRRVPTHNPTGTLLDAFLDLVSKVFMDQLFDRKEFPGFGLFTKVPPGFQEHQAYFESYILKRMMMQVASRIQTSQKKICEPRILTNLSRFCLHLSEAIFEGWFLDGAENMIDFNGMLLEFLQRPDISSMKSVRLCSQAVSMVRSCFLRIILLKLSDLDDSKATQKEARSFLDKMAYWQMSILDCFQADDDYLKLFWYQLYTKLVENAPSVRQAAASFMRVIFVQKPDESISVIQSCMMPDQKQLTKDFYKLAEVDDETFVEWVDKRRPSLDALFFGSMAKTWEEFVSTENARTLETARFRITKRKEKLKTWHAGEMADEKVLFNHEIGNNAWMKSIYHSEYVKSQRLVQDQQDDLAFLIPSYRKMERDLRRPGAVFSEPSPFKWKLDRTEGRNRMRLRLLPDHTAMDNSFQPKRRGDGAQATLKINTSEATSSSIAPGPNSPTKSVRRISISREGNGESEVSLEEEGTGRSNHGFEPEEDFELVDDPTDPDGGESFEDKNRKVLRRLQHGDEVQGAFNISRVTGLEACEGILIIGRDALYMMDNVFQCSNGDIVNVWQAPAEERDPFTMVVIGAKTLEKRQNAGNREQESRHWRWHDVISISKRRFLFRDVAIEIFFTDGRSYLLTTINTAIRDELSVKLHSRAPHTSTVHALPNPEDAWRLESLKVVDDAPQGLGSRLGTLFNAGPWTPIMKKWQRGEVSNFHYLMMVNTLAGRTFNDLTQYPVFPWIIADYTSDDLDLDDPATFRDLSKPMGAQTQDRVKGFVETYNALAEIEQPPFHYGTHYSSAMIVSSYLIRLPPFVQSYLLVQGDSFDHADRLFQSIPDAWASASRKNKTDVRELIPEFFCLPEFLTNINDYDFGRRQSTGQKVDHVVLPPWAKGDPKIFIAKHREALESPYVSENLHHWIDLIFGYKQRGEAAVENLNVFHNLSYGGASDLDRITDANERAVTAGVIHNFGQTPHQVFTKPHPPRENVKCSIRRLDTAIFSLRCLPNPLLDSQERVASLTYAAKLDRLLCASPFRLNFPPYDKFLEWGYADNSIRFFFNDSRKSAGLFENLHIGQISCATFADSKTLITAGEDCVISVHSVITSSGKPVELAAKSSLFGHKTPVTTMAVSRAFSTLVTVSSDGQALLWDLNQLAFIRKLPLVRAVEDAKINDVTGEIILCSGPNILLYTLNGSLILDTNICLDRDDYVHSCAFYQGAGNEWLEDQLIFTGHKRGCVNVWRKSIKAGRWSLELLRRLDHIDLKSDKGGNTEAGITCVSPMPTCLYTGDDDGRVVSFSQMTLCEHYTDLRKYEWNFGARDR